MAGICLRHESPVPVHFAICLRHESPIHPERSGRKEGNKEMGEEWKRKRGKQERKREEGFIATTMALNCEGNVG